MKKILILANNLVGLYNFRFELVKRLIDEKYKVYFAIPESIEEEKTKRLTEIGANYIYTPMNRRGMNPLEDFKLIKLYKDIISEIKPDIILTYTIKPNIYGNYIANKFKTPVIMNITGIGSSLTTGKLKFVIKNMYKYGCNKSDTVFFQNQENLKFFTENNLVDKSKTKVIPGSGVNIDRFKPKDKSNIDETIRFLFIARLMKEKGIEEYLKAAEEIIKKHSNVEFQIIGSFEEEKYKEQIINNNNKKIVYLGQSEDVREQIKEVDCIVNPSYHEGMSNVLLEGAAMGKPLIACDIPGCREIIDEDHNGYLCKVKCSESLEEKLIKFIELKNEKKQSMIENSREKVVNEFDRNIVVDEYIKTIENILNKR